MSYFPELEAGYVTVMSWLDLRKEQGADVSEMVSDLQDVFDKYAAKMESMAPPFTDKYHEPMDLEGIRSSRPDGPRALPYNLNDDELYNKTLGALLGRSAGCVLGIPVEGWNRAAIEDWARMHDQPYPLSEYWTEIARTGDHYWEPLANFLKGGIDHVGPDDDLAYTVLGLLILEDYGIDFTTVDVGEAWLRYLPIACTAEHVALENLKKGLKPPMTALCGNPYMEWIGADIRSDPWGYVCPGLPEAAAELAYRDASISHVLNGTYGEMFFSAAIAAAFVNSDPMECLRIALSEIPANCRLAKTVKDTLDWCSSTDDWGVVVRRIEQEFARMSGAHTLNNAALTVAGLYYGQGDFEKTIAYTVMGGIDTDCTGATAGSIMGAILGAKGLPAKWVAPFGDRLTTYLKGHGVQSIGDLASRFCRVAAEVRKTGLA